MRGSRWECLPGISQVTEPENIAREDANPADRFASWRVACLAAAGESAIAVGLLTN